MRLLCNDSPEEIQLARRVARGLSLLYWIAGELETLAAQAIPDIYINPFSSDGRILAMFIYQSRPSVAKGTLSGELIVDDQGCMRVPVFRQ